MYGHNSPSQWPTGHSAPPPGGNGPPSGGTGWTSGGPVGAVGATRPKDPHWLALEVCREYARGKCNRRDEECKFAHPPAHVDVQNGRVTCCFDSLHQRCHRVDPPCKYFHPPDHLKEQLTAGSHGGAGGAARAPLRADLGRSMLGASAGGGGGGPMMGGQGAGAVGGGGSVPHMMSTVLSFMNPYATQNAAGSFNHYLAAQVLAAQGAGGPGGAQTMYGGTGSGGGGDMGGPHAVGGTGGGGGAVGWMLPAGLSAYTPVTRAPRSDKIEICREFQRGTCSRDPSECRYAHPPDDIATDADNQVTVCMDYIKGRCARATCRYFHLPPHLQSQLRASGGGGGAAGAHRTSPAHAMSAPSGLSSAMAALHLSPSSTHSGGASGGASAGGSMMYGGMGGGMGGSFHPALTAWTQQQQQQLALQQSLSSMYPSHSAAGPMLPPSDPSARF